MTWTTFDEINFLQHLGSWRNQQDMNDRAQLMQGYLKGMRKRKIWDGLDREAIRTYLETGMGPVKKRGAEFLKEPQKGQYQESGSDGNSS
jgi:hypothetical protein